MGLRIGDEPVPNYRLVRFLGRGGFGQVWAATSPGGIHVALKIIDLSGREGVKEFKALRLMKSIRQANLTPILAFWLKDEDGQLVDESQVGNDLSSNAQPTSVQGTVLINSLSKMRPDELIIAMGLGDKTLSDRLRECNEQGLAGIPPDELFNYMIDAARAIDFLNTPRHDLGHGPISPIQHCDIKPQNILIVGDTAQVCDFGLARELGTNVKMTSAAVSPAYGAPELIEGRPPSGATDQYSLAITYVELRTGGLPFADPDSYLHVVNAHLYGGLDLNGLTAPEQDVIRKATSREPADRFESALKMVKALRQACPDDGGSLRVMPTQSRHGTGAQVGSDLNVTMPLPGASTGHSTMPVPLMPQKSSGLTETPGARVHVTKVDSRLQATTTHLEDDLAIEGERVRKKRGRIWKTAAALGVLGVVIGAAVYFNRPSDPKDQALIAAQQNIIAGVREPELEKRAGYFYDAYRECQKYASDPELRRTMDDAQASLVETWEKVVEKGNGMVLPIADSTPSEASLLEGIGFFDDFLKEFKDAPGVFRVQDARDEIASQAATRFVEEGEAALKPATIAPADLTAITRKFSKAAEILNEDDELHFRAKLGLARVAARQGRFSLEDAQYLDTKLHELRGRVIDVDPLLEAQIHVLSALAEREKSKDDPGPALQALKKLYPVGIRLLRNPAMGGAELSQVDELLAWAGGLSPSESDREVIGELQSAGIGQAVDEAHSKFQSIVQTKDPAERTAALQSLRDAIKRGLASNDPGAKAGFEELRALTDLVDPKAPATEISNAIAWFAAADGQKLHMSHWSEAFNDLISRDPAHLGPVIEALEKHAGEAKVIATLPNLYRQYFLRFLTEPTQTKDYFAVLASASERLRSLGADNRLSNIAHAEGLHATQSDKSNLPELSDKIAKSLARADQQPEMPAEQAKYEEFVRLVLRIGGGLPGDADRSTIEQFVKYATSDPPGYGFAVGPRRGELASLAVRAAASVRAGADGILDVAAIAEPYGKEGSGPKVAYGLLEGAKSLAPGIEKDPRYLANLLLAIWHRGEMGHQLVADQFRSEVLELANNSTLPDHERLPILYVRVQLPTKDDVHEDRADAMNAMSTLFEALIRSETMVFEDDRIAKLGATASRWIEQVQASSPTDDELKKQLARLAYNLARLQKRYATRESETDRDAWHKLFTVATKFDDRNESYLAARGFSALELDSPLTDEAYNDALKLKEVAPGSASTEGLMAFVKLAQSRRERDPAKREQLAKEAVDAGRAAIKTKPDKEYLATYLVHLGDSYVAWANYGAKDRKVQEERLRGAIGCIEQAQGLGLKVFVYRDFADVVLGNAHEDLAWLAQVGTDAEISKNYDEAIAAFKRVAKRNVAFGNMNLGRCYYKRNEFHEKGYLRDAKDALEIAIARRKDYAEAYRWLAAVYEAEKNYDLAAENYSKAATFAKSQHSYNHGLYECYWAAALVQTKGAPATIRAEILKHLDSVGPGDEKARKDLQLAFGKTYENEGEWLKAISHYTSAIGDSPKVIDADLLRRRADARSRLVMAKLAKKEDVIVECRECANDSNSVIALDKANATLTDLFFQASANHLCWGISRGRSNDFQVFLERSITAFDAALAKIEKLPKRTDVDWTLVEDVFDRYIELLLEPNLKTDFLRMGAIGRAKATGATERLKNAAGNVGVEFQKRLVADKLNMHFQDQIRSLRNLANQN